MVALFSCTDGDLATLARNGKQAAFRTLLDRHRAMVFRIARHHSGDDDAALDITQASFIAAFAAISSYDPARSYPHWIARITLNKARDWRRRRKVREFFHQALPISEAHDLGDPQPSAEEHLADRQELRRTMTAMATLPTKLKEVLLLRTIEGLSQAETAALLAVSEKTVETRLYRARRNLQEILKTPVPPARQ